MMVEHTRHSIAEHHEIDECIEKVEQADKDSSDWLAHTKVLDHQARHQLEDEEKSFFFNGPERYLARLRKLS